MELREVLSSVQCLDMDIDDKGVIRDKSDPHLWYALVDGDVLKFATCLRGTGLSEIALEDVLALGSVDVDHLLSVQTVEGWDFCNAARDNLDPPPERECEDPIPTLNIGEIIDVDELNKSKTGKLRDYMRLFPMLFPQAEHGIYYDELKECIVVDMSIFGRPRRKAQRMTDEISAIYHLVAENALYDAGIKTEFSWRVMDEALRVWGEDHRHNPFLEWVQGLKWDGKPRLATMFRDLLGGRAPPLNPQDEERYLAAVARSWLAGAIAKSYEPIQHEIVPVLVSKQQGLGKGTALRYLAGRDEWFKDVTVSPKQLDKFLEAVRGRIIVELSEGASLKGNAEDIKAFISTREDQMRKPYGHYENVYPRHFVMAVSTNNPTLFTDVTGNRRFFPIYCDPKRALISGSEANGYMEQLWAEVYYEYHHGANTYMTIEEQDLAEPVQDYATVENGNVIAIDDYLDNPINGLTELGSKISRAYIMDRVFGYTGNLVPKDIESAYRIWTLGTKRWVRSEGTIRVEGKACRGYIRICAPGEVPKTERLPITSKDPPGTLEEEFAKLTENKSIGDILFFDRFYVKDMSREVAIQTLLDEGYIYMQSQNGITEYRLGEKP